MMLHENRHTGADSAVDLDEQSGEAETVQVHHVGLHGGDSSRQLVVVGLEEVLDALPRDHRAVTDGSTAPDRVDVAC